MKNFRQIIQFSNKKNPLGTEQLSRDQILLYFFIRSFQQDQQSKLSAAVTSSRITKVEQSRTLGQLFFKKPSILQQKNNSQKKSTTFIKKVNIFCIFTAIIETSHITDKLSKVHRFCLLANSCLFINK